MFHYNVKIDKLLSILRKGEEKMLINCPNCNKPVSDKAEKCIHCGAKVMKEEIKSQSYEKKIDFMTLSKEQVNQYLDQFKREEPEKSRAYTNNMVKTKCMNLIQIIGLGVMFVVLLLAFICKVTMLYYVAIAVAVVALVSTIAITVAVNQNRTAEFTSLKYFEIWLNKKGVYNVHITFGKAEHQAQYDKIEIE